MGTALDLIPSAMAVWSLDRPYCILNQKAFQLVGFSSRDFRENTSLWLDRIHPEDHDLFLTAREKIRSENKAVSCDYRFLPKGRKREIWLRDVSESYRIQGSERENITSSYTDISELIELRRKNEKEESFPYQMEIIPGLLHEIRNILQSISLEFSLLQLKGAEPLGSQAITSGVERTSALMQELDEYFSLPKFQLSTVDPELVLADFVQYMESELLAHGIRLTLVRRGFLPKVRLDLSQFRSALKRIIEFARLLLPKGSELKIDAAVREIDEERYVELSVSSPCTNSLQVKESDIFRPFLNVNNHQLGLSMALADQILRRHQGKVSFNSHDRQQGTFTILLRTVSD